jgi:hypothetical protein
VRNSPVIAGIDLSSHALHICTLDDDTNHATVHVVRLDLQRGDAQTRIRRMRDLMPARTSWADAGVTLIAIERPIAIHSSVPLMVYGALLQLIPPDMPLLELRADDWRRECLLPIRGEKSKLKKASIDYARAVWTNAPPTFDDNVAESVCIAWAAREIDIRRQEEAAA